MQKIPIAPKHFLGIPVRVDSGILIYKRLRKCRNNLKPNPILKTSDVYEAIGCHRDK